MSPFPNYRLFFTDFRMGRKGGKGEEGEGKSFPSLRVESPPHLGRKSRTWWQQQPHSKGNRKRGIFPYNKSQVHCNWLLGTFWLLHMCFGIDHGRERETHLAHPLKRGKGHLIPSSLCTHTFACIERPAKAKGPLSLFLPSASSVTASAFGDGAKGELDQRGKGGSPARPPILPLSAATKCDTHRPAYGQKNCSANYWIFGAGESTDPILGSGRFPQIPVVILPISRRVIGVQLWRPPLFGLSIPFPWRMADGGGPLPTFSQTLLQQKAGRGEWKRRRRRRKREEPPGDGGEGGQMSKTIFLAKHQQGIPWSVRSPQCNLGADKSQLPCTQHLH